MLSVCVRPVLFDPNLTENFRGHIKEPAPRRASSLSKQIKVARVVKRETLIVQQRNVYLQSLQGMCLICSLPEDKYCKYYKCRLIEILKKLETKLFPTLPSKPRKAGNS